MNHEITLCIYIQRTLNIRVSLFLHQRHSLSSNKDTVANSTEQSPIHPTAQTKTQQPESHFNYRGRK